MRSLRHFPIVGLIAVSFLAWACGETGGGGTTVATDPTGTEPGAAATVEVSLLDYAFRGLPEEVGPGTEFSVINESESELHEMVAFLLPEDETRPASDLIALPEEEFGALVAGPPAMVLLAPPGGEMVTAVGDGTLTDPGRYLVVCAIPLGADPQEYLDAAAQSGDEPPEVEGGPPHFTQGMFGEVTVGG